MAEPTDTPPAPPSPPTEQPPNTAPSRRPRSPGGMVIAVVVLAVAVLGLTGLTRSCSFSPGGPSTNGATVPTVEVTPELQAAAGQVHFPIRQPRLPAGWHANSADLNQISDNGANNPQYPDLRIGWISPAGNYVALAQSNANPADLARQEGEFAEGTAMNPQGQVEVDGRQWTVYAGVRAEKSWVINLGPVRLLVTGNGTTAEFQTMAAAAQSGPVVSATS